VLFRSDPAKLAQEMSLRKLCYEIEKLEQESPQETIPSGPQNESPEETIPEEPQNRPEVPQRRKHGLSGLLDTSRDEEGDRVAKRHEMDGSP